MKAIMVLFLALTLTGGCAVEKPVSKFDAATLAKTAQYLRDNGADPIDYILDKFETHDVVIVGEHHYIKHNPEFIRDLLPVMHENGINVLATEFARHEDQPLIDSLLAGESYDENLARRITFLQFVHWPLREYVDILKRGWEINHALKPGATPFRIVGMNCSPDWSCVKSSGDRDDPAVMKNVWHGCTEQDWARVVLDEIARGEKALVYCGIHHGFSGYGQPIVVDGKFFRFDRSRLGNYLLDSLDERVMTVYLHAPWSGPNGYDDSSVRPADGLIDDAVAVLGDEAGPVGFDVVGSPLDSIPLENSVYRNGYDPFTLGLFCDGYIYTKPFDQYERVTVIPDFLTPEDLEYARAQTPNPDARDFTVESYHTDAVNDLNRLVSSWHNLGTP